MSSRDALASALSLAFLAGPWTHARLVERGESATKLNLIVIREGAFDLAAHLVISRIIALEKLKACVQPTQQHLIAEGDAILDRSSDGLARAADFVVGVFRFLLHQRSQASDFGLVNAGSETGECQTTQIGGLLERANMSTRERGVGRHVGFFDTGQQAFDLAGFSGVDPGNRAGDQ